MKNVIIRLPFILFFMEVSLTTIETNAFNLPDSIPKGWRYFSTYKPDYVIGTDTSVRHNGKVSGFIQRPLALKPSPGYVTLMQSIAADGFRNKRVKLTVYARSIELESGAYFFFQADGTDTILIYANTAGKMIEETNEWTLYHITLDVPEAAINIRFGATITSGQGTIWLDDFNLEVVDQNIPSDDWVAPRKLRMAATMKHILPNAIAMNLGFEDR